MLGLERPRGLGRDPVELGAHRAMLEQRGRDLRQERRLLGSPARTGGELGDDDRDDEVDGERDPVLAVAQRKRVDRGQEEKVEDELARDRDGDRVEQAPEDGDRQHREDVKGAQAEHGRHGPKGVDSARDESDRRDAEERAAHVMHRGIVTG